MTPKPHISAVGGRIFYATIVPAFEMSSDCFEKPHRPIRRVSQTPNEIISSLILDHKSLTLPPEASTIPALSLIAISSIMLFEYKLRLDLHLFF